MAEETYTSWGTIKKSHGLAGEVKVHLKPLPVNIQNMGSVFLRVQGVPVPFFISKARYTIKPSQAIVAFEDVTTIEQASDLSGVEILVPNIVLEEVGYVPFSVLIGYEVKDHQLGVIGKVSDVYEESVQPLFAVSIKGKEALIPYHEDLVPDIDHDKKIIYTQLPEGLIDVYLNEE